jgi:hypothetical protein
MAAGDVVFVPYAGEAQLHHVQARRSRSDINLPLRWLGWLPLQRPTAAVPLPPQCAAGSASAQCASARSQALIEKDLSEPYSVFTYRYFLNNWPDLCLLVRSAPCPD